MIAPIIGLVFGLVVLFLGMALLEQDRKDKKKLAQERQQRTEEADADNLAQALVDEEQPLPTFMDIRRVKLGAFMVAQGVLLAVIGMTLLALNAYWRPVAWYISTAVVGGIAVASVVTDAYMMGAPKSDAVSDEAVAEQTYDENAGANDDSEV